MEIGRLIGIKEFEGERENFVLSIGRPKLVRESAGEI